MKRDSGKNDRGKENQPPVQFLPPLKPRPVLTLILFIAVIAWLAALLVMRFTMVRPYIQAPTPAAATNP